MTRNGAVLILMVLMFSLTSVSAVFAAEGPDGNKRKGKYTYRKLCKACFEAGQVDSATPKVSPSDKKMAEWKTVFENRQFGVFGCEEQWAGLSDSDILDIYSYFYSFAADSPTPATCK